MKKSFIFILLLAGATLSSGQQQETDIKFRLAQGHERSGNYEAAIRLYEELYRKDSTNYPVFDALRRAYLQIKQYDKAIDLTSRRLIASPKDIGLLAQLGTMHARAGDESKAAAAWDRAVACDPSNESTYRIVASAMIESRLFERAIATYRRGRETLHRPTLYANDLAYIHSIMLNYADATREYLSILRETPGQLSYVQSRIGMFTSRADGLSAATTVAEQAANASADDIAIQRLLSWLYMEGKKFDAAYEVVTRVDALSRSNGIELFAFAERALHDRAFSVSATAYADIARRYPKFPMLANVKYGYARSIEEQTVEETGTATVPRDSSAPVSEFGQGLSRALTAYADVVREFPGTEVAAQSLIRTASIQFNHFFNIDASLAALENVRSVFAKNPALLLEARLLIGEILVAKGDLGAAESAFSDVMSSRESVKDLRDRAAFRRAELLYFKGSFKDAAQQLQDLTRDAAANITNDALDLQIFIKENLESSEPVLREFARADLLRRQRRQSEALAVYAELLRSNSAPALADEALMNSGDIYADLGKYPEALAAFDTLAQKFPESINLDRAQMRTALIYETGLHDRDKAIAAYQSLLEKFPTSILVSEARKRVRMLRGDSL